MQIIAPAKRMAVRHWWRPIIVLYLEYEVILEKHVAHDGEVVDDD